MHEDFLKCFSFFTGDVFCKAFYFDNDPEKENWWFNFLQSQFLLFGVANIFHGEMFLPHVIRLQKMVYTSREWICFSCYNCKNCYQGMKNWKENYSLKNQFCFPNKMLRQTYPLCSKWNNTRNKEISKKYKINVFS